MIMRKSLLSLVLMLLPMVAMADNVEINGIYYTLADDGNAKVASNPNQYSGDVVIPAMVEYGDKTYNVTSIAAFAFRNSSGMTSITIPNSITSTGAGAFQGCSGLTKVTLDCQVVYSWFGGMTSIKEVILGENVTSLDMFAFSGCTGLTSMTIDSGITSIPMYAFHNCTGLTSVTFGNGITSIADYAFENCNNLTSVTIGSGITSIGDYAFNNCNNLTSVTFNCKEVGSWFKAKKSIKEVTLGENVTSLGTRAFYACSGLTSITIPSNVTSIGDFALQGCSGLTSLTVPSTVTSFGFEPFEDCTGLTSITLDCKEVGNWFNRDLPNVRELVLGEHVTSVGSDGFVAFHGLNHLTSVTSLSTTPPTLHSRIGEATMVVILGTLYVPVGCKDIYKQQLFWEEFRNIQEINTTGINNTIRNGRNDGVIYNLNGSKVDANSIGKGIYIKNGKKVIVK